MHWGKCDRCGQWAVACLLGYCTETYIAGLGWVSWDSGGDDRERNDDSDCALSRVQPASSQVFAASQELYTRVVRVSDMDIWMQENNMRNGRWRLIESQ